MKLDFEYVIIRAEDDNTMIMNNTCVAFGSFEFVHRGHRKIAEKVVEVAKTRGLTPVIVCIEDDQLTFTTFEEKEYLLKQLGVEMILSFREIDPLLLLRILAAKVVVVGEGSQHLEKLQAGSGECEIVTVPTERYHGVAISEELLGKLYENSEYELLTKLCNHPYIMIGEVVHGKALGRTENMPTANIQIPDNKILPKEAVYATSIRLGGELLKAVTNIGKRPTVDDYEYITVESLILDFERDIYGEKLVLEIHEFIRDIKKFEILAEVKTQVDKDIERVRRVDDNSYYLEEYILQDGKKHPFALICPGGAYESVASFVEGRPYAQELNRRGYSAFIVHYRYKEKGRFPIPQEDVVRALTYILQRAEEWNLETKNYSLWGASAGGHLAASMGREDIGFAKYGLPSPSAITLSYPVITMGDKTHLGSRANLLGPNPTEDNISWTSVEKHITEKYPPTFIWYGDADSTVNPINSQMLAEALKENNVPYVLREYKNVEHGAGLGRGLPCEGWIEEAVSFWMENAKD